MPLLWGPSGLFHVIWQCVESQGPLVVILLGFDCCSINTNAKIKRYSEEKCSNSFAEYVYLFIWKLGLGKTHIFLLRALDFENRGSFLHATFRYHLGLSQIITTSGPFGFVGSTSPNLWHILTHQCFQKHLIISGTSWITTWNYSLPHLFLIASLISLYNWY